MTKKDDKAGTTGLLMALVSGLALGHDEQVRAAAMLLAKEHGVGAYAQRILRRTTTCS